MSEIKVVSYRPEFQGAWDNFVTSSRNGTFLHLRTYMAYHEHRFDERSVIVLRDERPIALFPATYQNGSIVSHGGLTFGGLLYGFPLRAAISIDALKAIMDHYRSADASEIIYKAIPHIFHRYPAEEDLYALFVQDAELFQRDISSAIALDRMPKISDSRLQGIKRARAAEVTVATGEFFELFHRLLCSVLEKFGKIPAHSAGDLVYLREKFPQNIELRGAFEGGELLAAALLFNYGRVIHTQYLASSVRGREVGALDLLLVDIIKSISNRAEYLNFGISTEGDGRTLNQGLIFQKEGFGGRGVIYDQYKLDI